MARPQGFCAIKELSRVICSVASAVAEPSVAAGASVAGISVAAGASVTAGASVAGACVGVAAAPQALNKRLKSAMTERVKNNERCFIFYLLQIYELDFNVLATGSSNF